MYIYTIKQINNPRTVYVGSTNDFQKRQYHHKSCSKLNVDCPLYRYINENGGWHNFSMEIYKEIDTSNVELKQHEGDLIKSYMYDPNYDIINKKIAGRTSLQSIKDRYKDDEAFRNRIKQNAKRHYYNKKQKLNTEPI